jgi:hypothetical protein
VPGSSIITNGFPQSGSQSPGKLSPLLVIKSRDVLLICAELCGKEGSHMQLFIPALILPETTVELARLPYLFVPRT